MEAYTEQKEEEAVEEKKDGEIEMEDNEAKKDSTR